MNEIPLVIEELYYQWAHIPAKTEWPEELIKMSEHEAEKLYTFYQGLRLGMRLSSACREP